MFDFEKPNIEIAEISEDKKYGKFVVEPLERGYGTTLGNSLRRIMLSSLPAFHQLVHIIGNLVIRDFGIDLGTDDICMPHHLGDAFYRNSCGNQQGSESVPGLVLLINPILCWISG